MNVKIVTHDFGAAGAVVPWLIAFVTFNFLFLALIVDLSLLVDVATMVFRGQMKFIIYIHLSPTQAHYTAHMCTN